MSEQDPAVPGRRVAKGAQFDLITQPVDLPNGQRVELDLLRHPGRLRSSPSLTRKLSC